MSGNSNTSTGSTASELGSILAGASLGYIDSQNNQPVTITEPVPGTAYGLAGTGQVTASTSTIAGLSPTMLLLGLGLVVAVVLLRR
ncbi:MAG: hypothetical protein ACREFP_26065 [Acetobacteraceae bacterium]